MYITSQILVVIGLIIDLAGRVLKNKNAILIFLALSYIFYTVSYVFLLSPLPAIANVVAMARTFLYLYLDKQKKSYKWYLASIIIFNAIFIIFTCLLWNNAMDLFLVFSMLILAVGLSFKNVNLVRVVLIVNSLAWFIYNMSLKAYANGACDIISILLVVGALFYYNRKSQRTIKQQTQKENIENIKQFNHKKLIKLLKNFDTFIFDFDGTLLNSEPYHKMAHSKVLSIILNKEINLTNDDFSRYIGKNDKEIFEMYKKDFNIEFDSVEMINKKVEIACELLLKDEVKIFDYFFELTKNNGNKKFYIVSNQHEKILFPVLEKKGIINQFKEIFCLSKMNVNKKYFYENIKEYIPNCKNIAVFEDDNKVFEYLKVFGYTAIGIENEMNVNKLTNCDFIIRTF